MLLIQLKSGSAFKGKYDKIGEGNNWRPKGVKLHLTPDCIKKKEAWILREYIKISV